jgi:hypothetical protein
VKFSGGLLLLKLSNTLGQSRLLKTFFYCFYIFSGIPSLASNNHVLG